MSIEKVNKLILLLLAVFLMSSALWIDYKKSSTYLISDAASYYAIAMSLAHDFDLKYEPIDLYRLYEVWQDGPHGLFLKKNTGSETIYFAKSYIYPLFCIPFIMLFKINGFILFNSLLLWLTIFYSYQFLKSQNNQGVTMIWLLTYYFLSPVYVYHFWIHPEIFNICLLGISLYYW